MTDSARPAFSPTLALLAVARTAEIRASALLEPHGLTVRSYRVLDALARTPGLSAGELARRTGIPAEGVPALTRTLRGAGLARAGRDGGELLSATRTASTLLATLRADLAALDAELFGGEAGEQLAAALFSATEPEPAAPQD